MTVFLAAIIALAALPPVAVMVARVVAIVGGLGLWYLTQAILGKRLQPACAAGVAIFDGVHHLTRRFNERLLTNERAANRLLFSSSLVIDLLGGYLLIASIVGPTIQPFLGLLMLFALRQLCQAFCPLPPPQGMIWRSPGFPTVLVTYGTSSDLFFSGHTALAVYGAMCLGSALGPAGIALGVAIAVFEISTVLVLRAHYTMDVFTGAITALYVHHLAWQIAPAVDAWIVRTVT
jgi:hypothetical protein